MNQVSSRKERKTFTGIAEKLAAHVAEHSRPGSSYAHLIPGPHKTQLFLPNGSKLYQIDQKTESYLNQLIALQDDQAIQHELIALGLDAPALIDDLPLKDPPLHAISLAIAQKCNMGCSYCYADQGDFGGPSRNMPLETALQAIDLLLKDRAKGDKVQLTFLGGEPLMNRRDLKLATEYAANMASQKQVDINFSITTNGTLVRKEDAAFFEEHGFAVTISLDGLKKAHNSLRPMKNGSGSFDRVINNIKPLLSKQNKMQVSARITVTPQNMNLSETLDEFIAMGFHSVGFSPLLNSSNGQNEMSPKDLKVLLTGMIECGLNFEHAVLQGKRYPFLNMINALKEIGKGTHRPYPCGAGAGYMGISAEGDLAACHRFVNEPKGYMGNVSSGIDPSLQNRWLAERHVHKQSPCNECWARYLCGGSCHHEVLEKGRTACDYIRGWLHFVIQSYERIHRLVPDWNQ